MATGVDYLEHRLTQSQKEAHDKKWYKAFIDHFDSRSFDNYSGVSDFGEYFRKKVNYELMNNNIDPRDFEYVTNPWGDDIGDLPAQLTNRDIISSKIKAALGIEVKRPFNWKVIAVNQEATTRKEQEEFGRLKNFVVSEIMRPIEEQAAMIIAQTAQAAPEQLEKVKAQIEEKLKAETPEEVKKYMRRKHQDPAEILASHLLTYLSHKERIKDKFNKGAKHAAIAGEEVYWVGEVNGEPHLRVINPLYFDYDKSPDLDYIEDGEWAVAEYRMTPHEVITEFELNNKEKDKIYQLYGRGANDSFDTYNFVGDTDSYVRVLHAVWKSLRKIGFLTYIDKNGEEQSRIVNETYQLNPETGDISLEWDWISEVHEGYKIGDIYTRMRPVPNQYKDLDNLYECKLPYVGATYDNDNSEVTSLVDRMRPYQYFYNILMYRIELLTAQDKGKKALFNIGAIPKSHGITLKQFEYFLDANSYGYLNPNEEGNKFGGEITNLVKEIDLSNMTDISKYVQLAEYIEERAGNSVGITKQLEGQIQEREAVSNVARSISLSTNILEDFFQKHDSVKLNVLTRLLETAKVSYTKGRPKKLSFVLDDMTMQMLTIDQELLDNSTFGIFLTNSSKAQETKEILTQLAHAALQNQTVDLSTVIKVLQADSIQEAEEILLLGEEEMRQRIEQAQQMQVQHERELQSQMLEFEREKMTHEKDVIRLKEELQKEREIAKQTLLALGFYDEKDINKDEIPDVLQAAKLLLEQKKVDLEEKKLEKEFSAPKK